MYHIVIIAGAWQLASWLLSLVDKIEKGDKPCV